MTPYHPLIFSPSLLYGSCFGGHFGHSFFFTLLGFWFKTEMPYFFLFNQAFCIFINFSMFQVLAALGKDYFERLLPDIIRNCSHQKASVRDGYLTLFKVR